MLASATAFAPGSIGNLAVGFDVLGLAIPEPGDTVTVARTPHGLTVEVEGDGGLLPRDASNTAAIAARDVLRRVGAEIGLHITVHKNMPIGSGLGSSAASAAAAAFATNVLLGEPLSAAELIGPCVEAEAAVSGRHADNVAPSLLGGLILVRSVDPLDWVRIPLPEGLAIAVVKPDCSVATRDARAVLPQTIPLSVASQRSADLASFVAACWAGDIEAIGRSLVDGVVEPARIPLIPGGAEAIAAARDLDVLGASISGAGPSVFALCRSLEAAHRAAAAMTRAFRATADLDARAVVGPADSPGARILATESA